MESGKGEERGKEEEGVVLELKKQRKKNQREKERKVLERKT